MADVSEVMDVLVGLAAAAAYPTGTGAPSVGGVPVKIYAGWPVSSTLDADLRAGHAHICVYSLPTERPTTRHLRKWNIVTPATTTITAVVAANTITLSGTVSTPQNIALLINGKPYVYPVQPADTLASIATALAQLVAADQSGTTSAGQVITLPASVYAALARVGGVATAAQELKRQEKQFQVTVWAPTPQIRSAFGGPIDVALSETTSLAFADGSYGILQYIRTIESDQNQKARLYRRDLIYTVDYATTQVVAAPTVIVTELDVIHEDSSQTIRTIYE